MRNKAVVSVCLVLAGCSSVTPQTAVNQLDPRSDKYGSQECRSARQIALSYEDNVGSRMGLGLGLGLLLGPFGIPLAAVADAAQAEKRNAVLSELKRHCEGPVAVAASTNAAKSDLQVRLELLNDLKSKGLLTEAEYNERRKKALD